MTKRILILLFSVMLTGMSEYSTSSSKRGGDYAHGKYPSFPPGSYDAEASYTARGGDYAHGGPYIPIGMYVDGGECVPTDEYGYGDTDCILMPLDAEDPVDQESKEEF